MYTDLHSTNEQIYYFTKFSLNWAVCYGPIIAVRNYLGQHQI